MNLKKLCLGSVVLILRGHQILLPLTEQEGITFTPKLSL